MSARPIHAGASVVAATLLACSGCATHARAHVPPSSRPARIGLTETGIASWYGIPYDGRRTASGEIFDMQRLTAAHRTLPFNTWLEVTNLSNGKQVDVRITDRGPFIKGRIIDLSLGAAREIDMVREGIVRVRIKVIKPRKQDIDKPVVASAPPEVDPVRGADRPVRAGSTDVPLQ